MRFIVLIIVLSFSGQMADADVYADCTNAIKNGNLEKAKRFAATIMRFNSFSAKDQASGAACVTFAMGKEYVFSYSLNTFAPKDEEATRIEQTQRAAEDRAVEIARQAAADSELNRLHRQAELEAQATKEAQTAAVWKRVQDACNLLYRLDPDKTITNQICLNIFLETGLPAK